MASLSYTHLGDVSLPPRALLLSFSPPFMISCSTSRQLYDQRIELVFQQSLANQAVASAEAQRLQIRAQQKKIESLEAELRAVREDRRRLMAPGVLWGSDTWRRTRNDGQRRSYPVRLMTPSSCGVVQHFSRHIFISCSLKTWIGCKLATKTKVPWATTKVICLGSQYSSFDVHPVQETFSSPKMENASLARF